MMMAAIKVTRMIPKIIINRRFIRGHPDSVLKTKNPAIAGRALVSHGKIRCRVDRTLFFAYAAELAVFVAEVFAAGFQGPDVADVG